MSSADWMGVNVDKCFHCGACVGSCPQNAIYLAEVVVEFSEKCNRCGRCLHLCPVGAITIEARK